MIDSFKRPIRLNTISPDVDYIMCIDENGGEGLFVHNKKLIESGKKININDNFLTITGTIFTRSNYSNTFFEMEQLKRKYWKDGVYIKNGSKTAVCFHSRDIRRQNVPFDNNSINRKEFLDDLTNTLQNSKCTIISSSINIEKYINSKRYNYDIYNTALQFLIERYIYATKNKKKGIIVIESRNQQLDKKILERINALFASGTSKIKSEEFKEKIIGVYFNKKWNKDKTHTYIGLETTDLFSYPIHKFIRSGEKDSSFSVLEAKLDKGIEKGIKIFP